MIIFYHLFLLIYKAGIRIVSLGNKKAKLWIKGREGIFKKLRNTVSGFSNEKIIWMHAASLGEFEQGRPVLQKLKEINSNIKIIVTFFSPSGFEIIKNNKEFTNIFYLPMDSRLHAEKWMNILKPDLVLWVKYEYWHYYLQEIQKRKIPLLMVSGIYRESQTFFKWYGSFYKNMLKPFTHFFVQNERSKQWLEKLVPAEKITISGDTRCDRVINIATSFTDVPGIADFCGDKKVVVAGSTWEEDEAEFTHYVRAHPEVKFIIAPHEIDRENLNDVQKQFAGSVFYSEWMSNRMTFNKKEINCLIIDNIGMLSRLYYYATVTYVGGGFGDDGLHNILEAAVYGKPVIFGPEYGKNFEAEEMLDCSGAISIKSAIELEKIIDQLLSENEELKVRSEAAKNYVYKNAGATDKIISFIESNKLL
ncbi:3-deoxy-D-manno-octulosonic acid transferase [Hanamia caeni]|uniref:3-deoxy-D-manno-octulosonic acid transferase n=1 Tax=Hanamia caeni TaxID=2294116 RepID=A0A3M9N810_9BACT|nr:glycosyltransferase N-terminal domain-containing protein [Hanamia caeni]RNI33353.1 3-deoxy-D-manno-octulosonic acid transferase [Hanamia caeni]